jgi:antitoxin component of MazEF toxin-antitoxin module
MNFSRIVTLPKIFTENYLDESNTVEISLSKDGKLILSPVKLTVGAE